MARRVRILTWNVNGIRAALKKDFLKWLAGASPDILCVQETKARPEQLGPDLLKPNGYEAVWNSAERPGYSGVATFSKTAPLSVKRGLGAERFDREGRVLETDHGDFTLLNIYFPNGGMNDERLKFKLDFYAEALRYFKALRRKGRKLVIAGDYNTAHKPIDLARPKENEKISGFRPEERAWLDRLVEAGFVDTFRALHPDEAGRYTWWDLRTFARERDIGWRIDYHFVSEELRPNLEEAFILPDVMGSDHCPAGLTLRF